MTTTVEPPSVEAPAALPEPRKFTYVPGLDGLRGLGVIFMMLYHTEVAWLGEGPLFTIEMFFALSGYLITSLFVVEHANTSRIDLRRFWTRRFRRLMPALLLMFFMVMLWSWLPEGAGGPTNVELNRLRGDGLSAMTYSSNWYFVFSGQSYFDAFAGKPPFKHTWSLSIEEQFYLLVALAVYWGFKRWGTQSKRWIWVCGGLALLSAAWMATLTYFGDLVASGQWIQIGPWEIDPVNTPTWVQRFFNFNGEGDPSRMYYGTDTRLQASLVGVAMAFAMTHVDYGKIKQWVVEAFGLVGLGGLLIMFFSVPKNARWIYYGGFMLADVFTAMSIVALMAPRRPRAAMPFQVKPLVWMGMLSYSLYVWHFPIFAILNGHRIIGVVDTPLHVIRFTISIVVAWASYRYYENHIRYKGLDRPWLRWGAIALVIVTAVGLVLSTSRAKPSLGDVGSRGVVPSAPLSTGKCSTNPLSMKVQNCVPIVFAGDSMAHTMLLNISLASADGNNGFLAHPATILGCGLVHADSVRHGKPVRQNPACGDWESLWREQVAKVNPSISLILAWGWDLDDRRIQDADGTFHDVLVGSDEWRELMGGTIQSGINILSERGGKVALLTMPCIDLTADTEQHPDPEPAEPHRVKAMNEVIVDVAVRNPSNTFVIDLNGFMCPDGEHYRNHIDDGPAMSDDGIHFTKEGSLIVWDWMRPQLNQVLAR